jgi:hypothetical protein
VKRISIRVRLLGLAGIAALAGACSSGGSVELGSGQSADPGSVDFPIAYVKRTIPATAGGQLVQDDVREMRDTLPDADLFFRDRASPSSAERNITDRVTAAILRHQDGCLVRRQEDRIRDARPARRRPGRGRSAELGHLGNTTSPRTTCTA